MGKKTKALSGASQDAYFRRVLKTQLELKVEDRDRLVSKLREDIAQLRLRKHGSADSKPLPKAAATAALPRRSTRSARTSSWLSARRGVMRRLPRSDASTTQSTCAFLRASNA